MLFTMYSSVNEGTASWGLYENWPMMMKKHADETVSYILDKCVCGKIQNLESLWPVSQMIKSFGNKQANLLGQGFETLILIHKYYVILILINIAVASPRFFIYILFGMPSLWSKFHFCFTDCHQISFLI